MIPEITQNNVHVFIPYKVSKICNYICESEKISPLQAIKRFYGTRTALLLGQEDTKLWQLGWVCLYQMYREEQDGK